MSDEIRHNFQSQEEGWGRMKVHTTIENISWDTSIWYDSRQGLYLLPLKADIRKKLKFKLGDSVKATVCVP